LRPHPTDLVNMEIYNCLTGALARCTAAARHQRKYQLLQGHSELQQRGRPCVAFLVVACVLYVLYIATPSLAPEVLPLEDIERDGAIP
jgi:hypothetical protein